MIVCFWEEWVALGGASWFHAAAMVHAMQYIVASPEVQLCVKSHRTPGFALRL